MKFNINDTVHVKLTKFGKEKLKEDHKRIFQGTSYLYLPPKEDENGWSTWKMHSLMSRLGIYLGVGLDLPFDTEIEIVDLH